MTRATMRDPGTDLTPDSTRSVALDGEPKLVFLNGPARGRVFSLASGRVRVGRKPENDIVVDLGYTVSSRHAVIYRDPEGGAWWVEDRGSKNGTFVNDERIERRRLAEGDVICFARQGPEARFTTGSPHLPGLVETSLSTFRRTGSIGRAVGEMLPAWVTGQRASGLSGVERILDDRLERITRRARWFVFTSVVCVVLLSVVALAVLLRGGPTAPAIVEDPQPAPVFPVAIVPQIEPIYSSLFFAARDHPIGRVRLINQGEERLEELRLRFEFLNEEAGYLVEPLVVAVPPLDAGAELDVALTPRISEKVRTQDTREVSAMIRLVRDGEVVKERPLAVFVHGYNIFNWENPSRITAFVNPQDPAVRPFVTEVLRARPRDAARDFPPKPFREAVSLVEALAAQDLRYVPDARTPTAEKIDERASDQVNFPWETLLNGTGDCDDLSVLCASVLEAAGIPTAIVVGPTHVLMMFDTGVPVAFLDSVPLEPDSVVVWDERVWVPLETTRLGGLGAGFSSLWTAALPRREQILSEDMDIVDVRRAWKQFPPAPGRSDASAVERVTRRRWVDDELPAAMEKAAAELEKVFEGTLQERVDAIDELEGAGPLRDHRVGVLHARSGLHAGAREAFTSALRGQLERLGTRLDPGEVLESVIAAAPARAELAPLLLDFGSSLALGARDRSGLRVAASCLEKAVAALAESDARVRAEALLRLALVYHLRGDLAAERASRERAFAASPALRDVYKTLLEGTGARAGEALAVRRYLAAGIGGLTLEGDAPGGGETAATGGGD